MRQSKCGWALGNLIVKKELLTRITLLPLMQLPFVNAFCTFFHQVAQLTYLLVILGHSGNRSLPRTGLLYTESTRGKEERKRVCACVWRRPTHRRCTLFYRNSSSNNSLQASRLLLFCVLCSVARNIHFESGKLLLRT